MEDIDKQLQYETKSLEEMIDKHIGVIGTKRRDKFEKKLNKNIFKRKNKQLNNSDILNKTNYPSLNGNTFTVEFTKEMINNTNI